MLVELRDGIGPVFLRPTEVVGISWQNKTIGHVSVWVRDSEEPFFVHGTPEEVHAALFSPPEALLNAVVAEALSPENYSDIPGPSDAPYTNGYAAGMREMLRLVRERLDLETKQ